MTILDKKIVPFIHFGFGRTQLTVPAGQSVKVWQDALYNTNVYETVLNIPTSRFSKVSDYEYNVTYNAPGTYNITLTVSNADKTISNTSNLITLIVE